jgi:hypothetical protein
MQRSGQSTPRASAQGGRGMTEPATKHAPAATPPASTCLRSSPDVDIYSLHKRTAPRVSVTFTEREEVLLALPIVRRRLRSTCLKHRYEIAGMSSHSRVRMITDFRFNLYNSTCEGS